ncbi:ATP-dependent nuclease [Trueperella pyogenes]|uniref:ATP-dependent nuclease n=1 Tax=Trueperella pyogenes TaxID=1661 RepID=UPI0013E91CC3|nr:AAA family ATPase [Trueperella pyogenes]
MADNGAKRRELKCEAGEILYLKELRVFGFKRFRSANVAFSEGVNIVVGDNDSGKSTLLEAITAVIDGQYRGVPLMRSLSEDLFNKEIVEEYLDSLNSHRPCNPPKIVIEAVFFGDGDAVALYKGDFNSKGSGAESGIVLEISLDMESFSEEYREFVASERHYGLPIEYYHCSWTTFARKNIRPAGIKFKSTLVGASSSLTWPGSKAMVTKIARDVLDGPDQIAVSQVHRRMRSGFSSDPIVKNINEKVSASTQSLTRKSVTFGFEAGTVNSWESGVITKLEDIPFSNVGDGTKSIVSTELALSKNEKRGGNVVLLEEPENHLSHTRLNMFLEGVKKRCSDVQLIVTTHSSFVANKMELRNLILLNGDKSASMASLSEETSRFFMKAPGYKTLRVLLCRTAILVEGDADELVLQRAYMDSNGGRLPIQDGIDVISVGTSFLRFLEVAKTIGKRTIAVTDNDGDIAALERKYRGYPHVSSAQSNNLQVVSYANRLLESGEAKGVNYNTLEAEVYESADRVTLSEIVGRSMHERDAALKYMESNKTEVALRIFDAEQTLSFPDYIRGFGSLCDKGLA